MTMSCPEVMYGAYYPYLYGRAAGPAARASSFASPFTAHQYDRFNVQTSQTLPQDVYGSGGSSALGGVGVSGVGGVAGVGVLGVGAGAQSLGHGHGHSSGGSVSSGGGAPPSPGSPGPVHHHPTSSAVRALNALNARLHAKEEDLSVQGRSSTEVAAAHASSDSESESGGAGVATSSGAGGGARAQYVSANCVVFTHYSGDVAAVVDEHFSRALSYADKGLNKEASPMSSRNFPASFWNSQWQPAASMAGMAGMAGVAGDLYGDPYHAHDPWTQHYQQYTAAAAHHHRAVHDYHHHHHNMAAAAQYSGLLLPPARLPHHAAAQYAKGTMDWSASHPSRLHHDQATAAHHSHAHALESAAAYSSYPTMAGLEAQVQESSKDLYWF